MKPFIRWAGGKQNLLKEVAKHLPEVEIVNNYFEPFLGAGSIFLSTNFKKSIISDINGDLINAFRAVKQDPEALHKILLKHRQKLDKDYYYKIRDQYNKNREKSGIDQAAKFIFLIHTSFNGIYRVNKLGEYNVPVGKLNPSLPTLQHLKEVSKKLKKTRLENFSYEKIFTMASSGDFVYLDPPYPPLNATSSFQHYTIDKFSEKEQENVANFANKLSSKGCLVLISNADVQYIRNLYKGWNIYEIETVRFVSCKKERNKVKELIIRNY